MILSERKNSEPQDYDDYRMNKKEIASAVGLSVLTVTGVAFLCYDSLWAMILLLPYIPYCLHNRAATLKEQRKWQLNLQFKDAIRSLSAVLESGYSIENAVAEAYNDLKLSYEEDAMIMKELKLITNMLRSNVPVENAFSAFAERSGLEDIKSFSDVFATAKRTGGNIISIIRSTASVINTRIELKRELKTVISAKKYESDIMRMIPFGVLIYLRLFSPEMVSALYGNTFGAVFMTILLAVYIALAAAAGKIINIAY